MTYATYIEVINTLPAIGSISNVTTAVVNTVIDRAESIINAKISRLYTVPVVPTPPLLTTISCDLTIYRLMTRRLFSGEQQNRSEWPDRYKEAMELLDQIADGSLQLVDSGGVLVSQAAGGDVAWSNTQGYQPTFAEDGDMASIIDEDKLDDLDGLRS